MKKILSSCFAVISLLVLTNCAFAAGILKTVDGYVKDVNRNTPVAGATVTFTAGSAIQPAYTATTDSTGHYVIPKLAWYSWENSNRIGYYIGVTAPGYINWTTKAGGQLIYFNDKKRYDIAVTPTAASELKGTVTDQAGRPISGITVTLKPNYYGYGTRDYTGITDRDGKYNLPDVLGYVYSSGGRHWVGYNLYISTPGYTDYTSDLLNFEKQRILTKDVMLAYQGRNYEGYVSNMYYSQDSAGTGYNERYLVTDTLGSEIGYIGIDRSSEDIVPLLRIAFQTRGKIIFTAGRIDNGAIIDVTYIQLNGDNTGIARIENKLGVDRE